MPPTPKERPQAMPRVSCIAPKRLCPKAKASLSFVHHPQTTWSKAKACPECQGTPPQRREAMAKAYPRVPHITPKWAEAKAKDAPSREDWLGGPKASPMSQGTSLWQPRTKCMTCPRSQKSASGDPKVGPQGGTIRDMTPTVCTHADERPTQRPWMSGSVPGWCH